MFQNKRQPEKLSTTPKAVVSANPFVAAGQKKSAETRSGNGALKFSTSGDGFVDQFTKSGSYKAPRAFNEIAADCEVLWAQDPLKATKFVGFLRTISRTVVLADGTKTAKAQKGTELKHEAVMRMIWLQMKQPEAFWNNVLLFVSLGSWHDVFTMLQYDLVYNGWNDRKLDWEKFGQVILAGLQNKNNSELVKKYLPQIKSRKQCTTIEAQANNQIAKWICSLLFGAKESASSYKAYRKLKTSGNAHSWQKLISQKRFSELDFNSIHGRALSILVRGKFLKNQGLSEDYTAWVTKPETAVKYTGFVHELFKPLDSRGFWQGSTVSIDKAQQETINKQFKTLVDKAREDNVTNLIVVRDTSGSMGSEATGAGMSANGVAKALALFFSEFLQGPFANSWIEFNSNAKMHTWQGQTPVDKWQNDKASYVGGTNFQSVIDLFVNIKKQGVAESNFPSGILCISDGEFNPAQLGKTNVDAAKATLLRAGFSQDYVDNFVIVLWNLQTGYYGRDTGKKFETHGDVQNVFYFGGYSGAVVSFLSEKIKTTYELMESALDQEVLNLFSIDAQPTKVAKKRAPRKKITEK